MSSQPLSQRVIAACRLYVDRLTWPGRDAPGSAFDDPATMARTFTYLFGVGATLLLVSLTLPHLDQFPGSARTVPQATGDGGRVSVPEGSHSVDDRIARASQKPT